MKKSRKKFWKKFKKKAWELLKYHPVSVGIVLVIAIVGLVYKVPGIIVFAIFPVGVFGLFEYVFRTLREDWRRFDAQLEEFKRQHGIKDDDED